jgi:hypothetical protein
MSHPKSPVEEILAEVIRLGVTSILKPLGFKKTRLNYVRRRGHVVQVVNLQMGHGSDSEDRQFYVNVAIAFNAICQLTGVEVLKEPKEHECAMRGTRDRLAKLVQDAPGQWHVGVNGDANRTIAKLRHCMQQLVSELEFIDGPQTYRDHHWFERNRPAAESAQILYVLEDLDGAWDEVGALCQLNAEREGYDRPEKWIEELGLKKLAERLESGDTA